MTYSAKDIITAIQAVAPGVQLQARGMPNGYARIFGPNANVAKNTHCYIAVLDPNGAICVKKHLQASLRAQLRPMDPNDPTRGVPISRHPLGCTTGTRYGSFQHGLPPDEILRRFPVDPVDFALALIGAVTTHKLVW